MMHFSGRRIGLLLVGVVAGVGVTVVGCSDDPSASPSTTSTSSSSSSSSTTTTSSTTSTLPPRVGASTLDGPVVTADPPTGGMGEEAAVSGELVLDGDCLLLRSGEVVEVPVWQSGTRWDPTVSEVILPDGGRVGLGDKIEAGGGWRPGGGLIREVSSLEGRQLAEQCARTAGSGVFVIQSPVAVIVAAP
jgi:hypothetical protein